MRKIILLFAFCLVLAISEAHADQYRVVAVSDGDTMTVEPLQGGNRFKVRLHGIDTPELRQSHGQAAKTFASNLVLYKEVDIRLTPQEADRYGRIVAVIEIPSVGILQEFLLSEGFAWVSPKYCTDCDYWEELQDKAREQHKGLWADNSPIEPWEWRKNRRIRYKIR